MNRTPRNLGRAYLVAKLGEAILSRRQAVQILNFIFFEMKNALSGRDVEFLLGWLVRRRLCWEE